MSLSRRSYEFFCKLSRVHNENIVVVSGYKNNYTHINVMCKNCSLEWKALPQNLIRGHGCPKCAGVQKHDKISFEKALQAKHGDIFDTSNVLYVNNKIHVTLTCFRCNHTFQAIPRNLISGKGCPKCAGNSYLSVEDIINKCISRKEYDYSSIKRHGKKIINIKCLKCGNIFEQGIRAHVYLNCGCPRCSKREPYTQTRFIERSLDIHGPAFSFELLPETFSSKEHIQLKCLSCYRLLQVTPPNHLIHRSGCPFCNKRSSKEELSWLDKLNIPDNARQLRIPGTRYHADAFYKNVVYEFNGSYWHGDPRIFKPEDVNQRCNKTFGKLYTETIEKERKLKQLGYSVITIWQFDWRNGLLESKKYPHEWLK